MKTFKERLMDCPIETLEVTIRNQEEHLKMIQRDLDTMREVLEERKTQLQQQVSRIVT
jgi:hypothetical protein